MIPAIVYAAGNTVSSTVDSLMAKIFALIVNPLIYLLFAIAFLYFVYGVFEYIRDAGEGKKDAVSTGAQHMLWGIIGLFIMVSAFALVRIVTSSVNEATGKKVDGPVYSIGTQTN
jgi:TRAP-type C4-dicarboxylate transport system permease small subunit